jgi:hypothetical protein
MTQPNYATRWPTHRRKARARRRERTASREVLAHILKRRGSKSNSDRQAADALVRGSAI